MSAPPLFSKILIANRGEIACRIIRTARRMGIATVAVYSAADRNALHVAMADEAVEIGPAPARQSYLVIERILDACQSTGADAVHPGYGFLSERAAFPRALEAAGITFIGPNAAAIDAMGDKIASKKFAAAAGVSTVPGHLGEIADAGEAARIAAEVGFPVMIKASAGGGGKGMRVAWDASEVEEGYARARSEAAASFGDDRIFIEKFIQNPRHIEIQVLADKHGNVVHLGERECSIQRRNQKIVEEAPSPLLDAATRAAMGEQACALARAVGYDSAGTVEFVAGQDRGFYFLEMNTRLQVEHPVTELVTGIDLVEQMIRVAAGEALSFAQSDVTLNGWAVESRIYAEDPFRGFLPSTGRLVRYRPPEEGCFAAVTLRNDTGVTEGAEISPHYDPLIAKLVTHAPTRLAAIDAQADALDAFLIDGIQPNIPFLAALMQHPRWREGRLSTAFIAEEFPEGFTGGPVTDAVRQTLALAALAMEIVRKDRLDRLNGRLRPHSGAVKTEWAIRLGRDWSEAQVVAAELGPPLVLEVGLDGAGQTVSVASRWRPGEPLWRGLIGGRAVCVAVRDIAGAPTLSWHGVTLPVRVMLPAVAVLDRLMPEKAPPDTSRFLLCPMPGLVIAIAVVEGQPVKAGETLAVVEAMKMENVLRAERDAVIAAVRVKAGDSLAVDAVILEFAAESR